MSDLLALRLKVLPDSRESRGEGKPVSHFEYLFNAHQPLLDSIGRKLLQREQATKDEAQQQFRREIESVARDHLQAAIKDWDPHWRRTLKKPFPSAFPSVDTSFPPVPALVLQPELEPERQIKFTPFAEMRVDYRTKKSLGLEGVPPSKLVCDEVMVLDCDRFESPLPIPGSDREFEPASQASTYVEEEAEDESQRDEKASCNWEAGTGKAKGDTTRYDPKEYSVDPDGTKLYAIEQFRQVLACYGVTISVHQLRRLARAGQLPARRLSEIHGSKLLLRKNYWLFRDDEPTVSAVRSLLTERDEEAMAQKGLVARQLLVQTEQAGVSTKQLQRLEQRGRLNPVRIGGRIYYKAEEIREEFGPNLEQLKPR